MAFKLGIGKEGKSPTFGKCEEKFWKRQGEILEEARENGDEHSAGIRDGKGRKGKRKQKGEKDRREREME